MSHYAHGTASHVHVVPMRVLITIFVILLFLTYLTVAATQIDLGPGANVFIAMAIAVIKGALVCLYFMHLRYDNPFNALCLVASILFVGLFLGIAILDTQQYRPQLNPKAPPAIQPTAASATP